MHDIAKVSSQKLILGMMLCFLSACGYHLKGSVVLPLALQKIYVSERASVPFIEALNTVYQHNSTGQVVKRKSDAGLIIEVLYENYSRHTLSLNTSGYSNEYELTYEIQFNLVNQQGKTLASNQKFIVKKTYYNEQQSDSLIAKQEEEQRLRQALYIEAVHRIIERSRALIKP